MRVKLGSSIEDVLSKALDPPASINVQRAVSMLVEASNSMITQCHFTSTPTGPSFDPSGRYHANGKVAKQVTDGRPSWQILVDCHSFSMLGSCTYDCGNSQLQISLHLTSRTGTRSR
jgi:hypothetical protein